MNFEELKNLAKKLGGIVVMNGNVPEIVILSYSVYKKLETGKGEIKNEDNAIERLNKEILALKEEIKQKEEQELLEAGEEEEGMETSNEAEEDSQEIINL